MQRKTEICLDVGLWMRKQFGIANWNENNWRPLLRTIGTPNLSLHINKFALALIGLIITYFISYMNTTTFSDKIVTPTWSYLRHARQVLTNDPTKNTLFWHVDFDQDSRNNFGQTGWPRRRFEQRIISVTRCSNKRSLFFS